MRIRRRAIEAECLLEIVRYSVYLTENDHNFPLDLMTGGAGYRRL